MKCNAIRLVLSIVGFGIFASNVYAQLPKPTITNAETQNKLVQLVGRVPTPPIHYVRGLGSATYPANTGAEKITIKLELQYSVNNNWQNIVIDTQTKFLFPNHQAGAFASESFWYPVDPAGGTQYRTIVTATLHYPHLNQTNASSVTSPIITLP